MLCYLIIWEIKEFCYRTSVIDHKCFICSSFSSRFETVIDDKQQVLIYFCYTEVGTYYLHASRTFILEFGLRLNRYPNSKMENESEKEKTNSYLNTEKGRGGNPIISKWNAYSISLISY